jgi:hypothetical protein
VRVDKDSHRVSSITRKVHLKAIDKMLDRVAAVTAGTGIDAIPPMQDQAMFTGVCRLA